MLTIISRDSSEEQQQAVANVKFDSLRDVSSMKRSYSGAVDYSSSTCKPKRKISMLRARSSESVVCTDARVIPGQTSILFNKPLEIRIVDTKTDITTTTATVSTQYSPFDLLVIGEHGSGATALASRFMGERLSPGLRCVARCGNRHVTATVQVFRDLNEVPASDLAKCSGIVFVACDKEALLRCSKQRISSLPCILVASKQDQAGNVDKLNQVDLDEIAQGFHGAFLVSALTGKNVDEAFECLLLEASLLRCRNKRKRSSGCIIS